jgi:phenylalanine-4-hydroxylase
MAFAVGGNKGVALAKKSQTVTTTVLDSGLEISGILNTVDGNPDEGPCFLRWQGPVQLSWQGNEISGQGISRHSQGFSAPLGPWEAYPDRNPADLTTLDLAKINLQVGQPGELRLASGIKISGVVVNLLRRSGKLIVITWDQCSVMRDKELLFKPEWGEFDQPVGLSIPSVYGGPADRHAYGAFYIGMPSSTPARRTPYTPKEKALFALYQRVRELRNLETTLANAPFTSATSEIAQKLMESYPEEWLLGVELWELVAQRPEARGKPYPWLEQLRSTVLNPAHYSAEIQHNIALGLKFAMVRD